MVLRRSLLQLLYELEGEVRLLMKLMKKTRNQFISIALSLLMVLALPVSAFASDFKYIHDPMQNELVKNEILVNPDAVFGFSPNPASERLGAFAKYDWTDEKVVLPISNERVIYHERVENELLALLDIGKKNGDSVEDIARALSERRNTIRLEEAEAAGTLEETKQSNLDNYGNENGQTPEYRFEKYGSWETVASKAFSTNVAIDVCLGLYDKYYDVYGVTDDLFATSANSFSIKKTSVTIKRKTLRKKNQSFFIKGRDAVGKVTYKPANTASQKALSVNTKGKVTVKKRTPDGTYKIKVTANGNQYFKKKTISITIRVK